jgi:hypothetical protein
MEALGEVVGQTIGKAPPRRTNFSHFPKLRSPVSVEEYEPEHRFASVCVTVSPNCTRQIQIPCRRSVGNEMKPL